MHLLCGICLDRADLDDPGIAEDDVKAAVALECATFSAMGVVTVAASMNSGVNRCTHP